MFVKGPDTDTKYVLTDRFEEFRTVAKPRTRYALQRPRDHGGLVPATEATGTSTTTTTTDGSTYRLLLTAEGPRSFVFTEIG